MKLSLPSTGRPLEAKTRADMEAVLGRHAPFSRVAFGAAGRPARAAVLPLSTPDDRFEREAERVAARVDRREAPATPRAFDFGRVRIHTDTRASESAAALGARAYTVGNDIVFQAGAYAPATAQGRQLLAHELVHVVQQQGAPRAVQRRTDPVISRPVRAGAEACLVHLHGNETHALRVARNLYGTHCVNLVYIDNPGQRNIHVDVPGHAGVTCRADPNRIFDNAAIDAKWADWNTGSCLRDPVKTAAIAAVRNYRDTELNPLIRQCRGQAADPRAEDRIAGQGLSGNRPIVVFHNNRPSSASARPVRRGTRCIEPLTIRSYLPGHCEYGATETDTARTGGLPNPSIENDQNVDNFFLVTRSDDFWNLVFWSRNVVLQKRNPPNDGSLSVAVSSGRYINVEGRTGHRRTNQEMGEEALASLRVSRLPCGGAGGSAAVAPAVPGRVMPAPVPRGQITSARLRRRRNPDLDRFLRQVYDQQVQLWRARGGTYVGSIPGRERVRLPARDVRPGRQVTVHRDIAARVRSLVADSRRAAAAAGSATTDVRVLSGYRSARTQLIIWEREYPRYYQATRLERRGLDGGEHGAAAARHLASYINQRVFSPGFSPHQQARTVDLTYRENNVWVGADTSATGLATWHSSWLFNWLQANAARYGFVQNPHINEPWHWEYRPDEAALTAAIEPVFGPMREALERILPRLSPSAGLSALEQLPASGGGGTTPSSQPPSGRETPRGGE